MHDDLLRQLLASPDTRDVNDGVKELWRRVARPILTMIRAFLPGTDQAGDRDELTRQTVLSLRGYRLLLAAEPHIEALAREIALIEIVAYFKEQGIPKRAR